MISQTSRYALRILGYLARHRSERVRGEQIAAATGIPANYLSKILGRLRKQGLVDGLKGWGGGFLLREDALGRPIAEALAIFEGDDVAERNDCLFGTGDCDEAHPCPLHEDWKKIRTLEDRMLTTRRIGDLATAD